MNVSVYEDNAGGLYMVIRGEEETEAVIHNWEYGERGNLLAAFAELREDPECWNFWDGDMAVDMLSSMDVEDPEGLTERLVREIESGCQLVAEVGENGEIVLYLSRMGLAALRAFAIEEADDE